MLILGFTKTTLLDYPQKVAATIFTGGCNFRCPYCHNGPLVLKADSAEQVAEEEILAHLRRRYGILDGVCISGGEPTLQPDIREFITKVKDMGYQVKLDTNGTNPGVLSSLIEENLLDYVAMDIKAPFDERYKIVTGTNGDCLDNVKKSVDILMNGSIDYEFRTTVARELLSADDLLAIAKSINSCTKWYIQSYVDTENVISPGYTAYTKEELADIVVSLERETGIRVQLRGV